MQKKNQNNNISLHIIFLILLIAITTSNSYSQQIIKGIVTSNEDGSSLPGVSVLIKDTNKGTITGINGDYSVEVENTESILVFSFVGMSTKEIKVGNKTTINVILKSDIGLDEIVVVAYGAKKRGAITGSVETIASEEFEQVPVASFDQIFQGKVTGVQAQASSGRPGASANVVIRGMGSINASSEPLYVIDGVPVEAANFAALNPNDIENMSVLKDASATAIYGSRASNGIILITTKKGKAGKTKFDFKMYYGISSALSNNFEMMNSQQKLDYEIEIGERIGEDAQQYVLDSLLSHDHNWKNDILRTGLTKSYELSASGGKDKTRFFISTNLYNEDGIVKGSYFDRITGRINLDHDAGRTDLGVNITVGNYKRGDIRSSRNELNPFQAMYSYNPYEAIYKDDGSWNPTHAGVNALENLETCPYTVNQLRGLGNFHVKYEILPGLELKNILGANFYETTRDYFVSPNSLLAGFTGDQKSNTYLRDFTYLTTTTLRYIKTLREKHNFTLLAGLETQKNKFELLSAIGERFPSDKVRTLSSAAIISGGNGSISEWALVSYLALANYDYNGKYYLDLSFRRDGSSRFSKDNRYGNFMSVGAAWNIIKEDFLLNAGNISNLKLRGSIGTSGNFNIGNYSSLDLYSFDSYNDLSASYPTQLPNPELTWEKNINSNIGLEFGFANNRISGNIDWYNRKTLDLLLNVPLSATSGFSSRLENVGSMLNHGWEFALRGDIIKSELIWNASFNISFNKNKILELYDGEDIESSYTILREGEPINSYYLVEWAGVHPGTGDALYYDKNGNPTNSFSGEDQILINKTATPDYFGGFTTALNYKGFDLSIDIFFSVGSHLYNYVQTIIESDGQAQFAKQNQSITLLDAWKNPGDITNIPRQDLLATKVATTRELQDASYGRLRNLTLAYSVPKKFLTKFKLRSLRVYAKGHNLLSLTAYNGLDPETSTVSEDYSSSVAITDVFGFPSSRTFTFGLDIGF